MGRVFGGSHQTSLLCEGNLCHSVGCQCAYDRDSAQTSSGGSQQARNPTRPRGVQAVNLPLVSPREIDPFRYASLRQATIDVIISKEALTILGDIQAVERTASKYFATIFLRMPISSRASFYQQLPSLYTTPRADFALWCLCMHLIVQRPDEVEHDASMHSSTYVVIKGFIAAMESITELTLMTIQAMVLIILYEMGHGSIQQLPSPLPHVRGVQELSN